MSADKIIEKIIADATADAGRIAKTARADAALRQRAAESDAVSRVAEIGKRAEADDAEIERRRMLTAGLDARKNTLARRRRLMDRVFDAALERFYGLSEADYTALVTKLIVAASETGDERVVVPVKDEKRYRGEKSMLAALNAALKSAGKPAKLTFGGTTSAIGGGVLLLGDIADVDCSFESLIAQFREDREMEVAGILFESGV